MGSISKSFALILIQIIAMSSLSFMLVKPANATPVIIATPTPSPTPEPTPVVTPTSNIALDYNEISRASDGDDTILVLTVNARYNFGDAVTLNYQDFVLWILTVRGGLAPLNLMMHTGDARPIETGSVTIGSISAKVDFTLTFRFLTIQNNFDGPHEFTSYELVYNANSATSSSPTPTPEPEPTPTTLVIASSVIIAVVCVGLLVYFKKRRRSTNGNFA
jgi:hypothetical protein